MTMVQQCLWNKPIRTETNSMGPGSTAGPFTTSYRINECFPTIFRSLILSPPFTHTHTTSIYFISFFFFKFFFFTPAHHEVFDFLSFFLCLLPSLIPPPPYAHTHTHPTTPPSSPPPLLLCAKVIVDAKGRGPRGSYQPITSVGMSGDEMECSRPASGLDGSFNAERGVCKQTAADRVYACHNRSGPWSIFAQPFRSPFLSPLFLSVSIFSTATWVTVFYFTSLSPPPKTFCSAFI